MNWRKNIVLVVGLGICLVLFIATAVCLVNRRADYVAVSKKVKAAQDRLNQLNQRNPFPSAENVTLSQTNLVKLQAYSVALMDSLQRDQPAVQSIEAADFAPMLEKAKQQLQKSAADAGVKMPDRFGLGFARYIGGDLPSTSAVPRLVVQLKAVESVFSQLFDAHISEVRGMERDIFEAPAEVADTPAQSRSRSRGAAATESGGAGKALEGLPVLETNDLYSAERIYVSFTARETALWTLLNSLAMSKPFIVVSDVKIENVLDLAKKAPAAGNAAKASPAAAAAATGKAAVPDREERVVAGREPVNVELVLDVYRFTGGKPQEVKP